MHFMRLKGQGVPVCPTVYCEMSRLKILTGDVSFEEVLGRSQLPKHELSLTVLMPSTAGFQLVSREVQISSSPWATSAMVMSLVPKMSETALVASVWQQRFTQNVSDIKGSW